MTGALRLTITTPVTILVDCDDVRSIRVVDDSGSFGILPGHADLLTVLPASVVEWKRMDGTVQYCTIRGGIFSMSGGDLAAIAARQGVLGDNLDQLEGAAHLAREAQTEADRQARVTQMRLHAQAVRQLMHNLLPGQRGESLDVLNQDSPR